MEEDQNIPSSDNLDETNHSEENTANEVTENTTEDFKNRIDLKPLQDSVEQIKQEIAKFIVGQNEMIELLIISILTNGHSLIEGVPGVAKTVTAKLLAKTLDVDFNRIQFTPDLMPSDILGTSIFNVKTSEFEYKKGPIFSNIVLIDEINRAPAKTQAALFEVMAERQITMDGTRYDMELPFLVFATQNPIEQEGTYRLPEAQLDRFLFKIEVDYPSLEDEVQILVDNHHRQDTMDFNTISSVLSADAIKTYQNLIKQIIVEDNLLNYIASIVNNTRANANLYLGASPRASIAILNAAKANAAINGRDFVTPDDIKRCTKAVLKHRLVLTPEREMEAFTVDKVVDQILETIEIPR
ncbi:MoxR family ATPase [Winogradskyella echinorum]|uniref:MoxR family ATPase n=1 Tax=Winogradskyella echinorum TaxID=538189 RepID=A0ABR6Y2G2_9FLAO|nr:MoxR family ATPase [Winogradskyella echinorum]MBC3846859.1 MoxR family ATPase [Winogradskyella echinorum]MBC5751207.1 MoxR family ATPase [Winogradskyella echinorum]